MHMLQHCYSQLPTTEPTIIKNTLRRTLVDTPDMDADNQVVSPSDNAPSNTSNLFY